MWKNFNRNCTVWLFAIFCCILINITASDNPANQNNVKYVPVSKECVLLYDNEFFIRESIERSAFIYKLKITGQIVRFTDIPDNEFCPGYIAITEIFATDRIIVDDDYNSFGDEITFIVGAPIWEIDGKRRINLNGQNSDTHENPNAYNGNRNGNRDGADGLVGFSGGPGAHFHGIALDVLNADKLTIKAQGGNGGDGQNGGNGAVGISGAMFDLDKSKIKRNGDVDGFDVIIKRNITPPDNESSLGFGIQEVVLGVRGTNGGKGGDGGEGGNGGLPGVYAFLDLQDSACNTKTIFKDVPFGRKGRGGKGGVGGMPGSPGTDVILKLYFPHGKEIEIRNELYNYQEELNNGENGMNGVSSLGMRRLGEHPHWQDFTSTIQNFYHYLTTHSNITSDIKILNKALDGTQNVINNFRCMFDIMQFERFDD